MLGIRSGSVKLESRSRKVHPEFPGQDARASTVGIRHVGPASDGGCVALTNWSTINAPTGEASAPASPSSFSATRRPRPMASRSTEAEDGEEPQSQETVCICPVRLTFVVGNVVCMERRGLRARSPRYATSMPCCHLAAPC